MAATLSAKSDTTIAIRYALNRWSALVCYCTDGRVEIDNLIAERALRGVALGRRNYSICLRAPDLTEAMLLPALGELLQQQAPGMNIRRA